MLINVTDNKSFMAEDEVYVLKVRTNDLHGSEKFKVRSKVFGRLIYSSTHPCYYSSGLLDNIRYFRTGNAYICESRFHVPEELKDRVSFTTLKRKFDFSRVPTGKEVHVNKAYLKGMNIKNVNMACYRFDK